MKKIFRILMVLAVLVSALLGSVSLLDTPTTMQGIIAASRGEVGTTIYANGENLVFIWTQGSRYGWAAMSQTGNAVYNFWHKVCNGNCTSVFTMTELIKLMTTQGYKTITPDKIPVEVLEVINGPITCWLISLGYSLTTIFVVPAFMLDISPLATETIRG